MPKGTSFHDLPEAFLVDGGGFCRNGLAVLYEPSSPSEDGTALQKSNPDVCP